MLCLQGLYFEGKTKAYTHKKKSNASTYDWHILNITAKKMHNFLTKTHSTVETFTF